jgi:hypothetical protein
MKQLSRTTRWRRSKGRPPSRRGRPRIGGEAEAYNLRLLAKLLRAVRLTTEEWDRPRAVSMAEALAVEWDAQCERIAAELLEYEIPVGFLVVEAWDALRPELHRRPSRAQGGKVDVRALARKLARRSEGRITLAQAVELLTDGLAQGAPWVTELMNGAESTSNSTQTSARAACPSRWFKISRPMVAHWRRIRGEIINPEIIRKQLHSLADAVPPVGRRLMAAEMAGSRSGA